MLAGNVLLSVASVVVCMLVFYLMSLLVNHYAHHAAYHFVWGLRHPVKMESIERYYVIRNVFIILGAITGLAGAQSSWWWNQVARKDSASNAAMT